MSVSSPVQQLSSDYVENLAKKWAATARTIFNWRAAGAPLDDDGAMKAWLMSRPKIPRGTAELLMRVQAGPAAVRPPKPRGRVVPTASVKVVDESQLGAAAALRRLAEEERIAHGEWKALVSNPDASIEQVESAAQQWLKISESLRRYELAVEQDRRQSGELLPRADLEAFAQGFLVNFCGSLRVGIESLAPRLAGLDSPQSVWKLLGDAFDRSVAESAGNVAKRPYAGRNCPEWLAKVVGEAVKRHL